MTFLRGVSNMFKKGVKGAGNLFRKVKHGVHKVGDVLGKAASVLDNPITHGLITAVAPEAEAGFRLVKGLVGSGKKIADVGKSVLGKAEDIGNIAHDAYKQGEKAVKSGLEKAKDIKKDIESVPNYMHFL